MTEINILGREQKRKLEEREKKRGGIFNKKNGPNEMLQLRENSKKKKFSPKSLITCYRFEFFSNHNFGLFNLPPKNH